MATEWRNFVDLDINVVNGTGSATFKLGRGEIDYISFLPPSGNRVFSYFLKDADGHGIHADDGLTAPTTCPVNKTFVYSVTLTLEGAFDGAWDIRAYLKYS